MAATMRSLARLSLLAESVGAQQCCSTTAVNDDLLAEFEERAAIMQFAGGLSRIEAERKAWVVVFGVSKNPENC